MDSVVIVLLCIPVAIIVILWIISCIIRPRISWSTDVTLEGKVVIITGANTGIGREVAIDLAKRDAKVYLACRDRTRGLQAQEEIRVESDNDKVYFMSLDLASLQSVRRFTEQFYHQETKLDILVNNAGILPYEYAETSDGFESAFGVNHLGQFLLTNLLLPLLKKSCPSRVVLVSSVMYKYAKLDLNDLKQRDSYSAALAYSNSKLAGLLYMHQLTKELSGTGVLVNAAHPGIVMTEIARNLPIIVQPIYNKLAGFVLKSPKEGAQTVLYCVLAEELDEVSGCYFVDCKKEELYPFALDEDLAEKVCKLSNDLTAA